MKIAFFYLAHQGGGVALDTFELAQGLSHLGEILCIVSSKSASYCVWERESQTNKNFKVLGVETTKNMIKGLLSIVNYSKFSRIRYTIDSFGPDVIYSHMEHPFEKLIIPKLRCKYVFKGLHDVRLHQGESSIKSRIIRLLTYYKPNYYVVFSHYSKEKLIEQGVKANVIIETVLSCSKVFNLGKTEDTVLYNRFIFFGRLIKYKGIDILFDCLKNVFEALPGVKLVIAGRGDISEYENVIKSFPDNLEIYNQWIKDEEISDFYANVDFTVAPYIDASQSGVVPLSFSFGKPVIVSKSGGLPEQVKEKETGLVIPIGDSKSLADAIISMYSDKDLLVQMKKNALRFSEELTWEKSAGKLYKEFESAISTYIL